MNSIKSNLVKTKTEIENIRKACLISSQLHLLAMSMRNVDITEKELSLILDKLKASSGNLSWAYQTIIGAGERATILHAKPTKRSMKEEELVLIDMGVKYKGYCSDITRTWPVGNKFTREQKTIYKIVLKAQKEVIKRVKPGETLSRLHEVCRYYLSEGLLSKGIIRKNELDHYFPHKTSHWIGKYVHDHCPYEYKDGSDIVLSEGMCFTVEPGLYFKGTNSKYESIGIRIEDVVMVTENGAEVLSHVPKEIAEIESIRYLRPTL